MSTCELEPGVLNDSPSDLAPQNEPEAGFFACPRKRAVVYALVLTLLSSVCSFYRLSEGTLFGDEAAFACTTERMHATGDLVVPYITDEPHLNATPLYNWLTLAIAPAFDNTPLWHRFWSAVFGIGCTLVGFALGTLLFRAEVGLLAGLFLAFNRGFLFDHGIRFGGMDAMLAFFISAAVFCYAWLLIRGTHVRLVWAILGGCIGLACLSKPPVFGGFFFVLICLHWLTGWRQGPFLARLMGPLVAVAVGLLVAGPWYGLLWSRLGNVGLHALFVHNSVERALDPSVRDPFACHHAIWHASTSFKLMEVALVSALVCWAAGYRRAQWGVLLFLAGGYLLALSVAGKAGNYIYYIFPLLAVLLAALFLESGPRLATWFRPNRGRMALAVGVGVAVVFLAIDGVRSVRTLTRPTWVHPPVGIYAKLAPELAQGSCRLVLCDFPYPGGVNASGAAYGNFEDLYYPTHMPLADRARHAGDVNRLLADGKPTVVLLPPRTVPQPPLQGLQPEVRIEDNPWPFYTYPVLTFHGAAARFSSEELPRLARGGQR